jgi:hypothetical protein
MNLKKLAMWKRRQQTMPPAPQPVAAAASFFVSNLLFAIKNSFQSFSWKLFLSTVWTTRFTGGHDWFYTLAKSVPRNKSF